MRKLFFSTALLLSAALMIQSCKKDLLGLNDADKLTAEDLLAHNDLSEQVDIDADASYQDAMSLISALHKSGLEEKDIRILDSRWR